MSRFSAASTLARKSTESSRPRFVPWGVGSGVLVDARELFDCGTGYVELVRSASVGAHTTDISRMAGDRSARFADSAFLKFGRYMYF